MNLYDLIVAKKLSGGGGGGGGGSSNVVTGSFKGTENGVLEVPLSYTGEGYPLSVLIYVKDGVETEPYYSIVCLNSVVQWAASKSDPTTAPTYTDGTTKNCVDYVVARKGSSKGSYGQTSGRASNIYRNQEPGAAAGTVVKFISSTIMKVRIADSDYGFYPNIDFAYTVTYSS